MRGLSLTQPWASLVACGAKTCETRSWKTSYRGLIAIHAAKGYPRKCQVLCSSQPYSIYLPGYGLPRGAIVAVAHLYDLVTTEIASAYLQAFAVEDRFCAYPEHELAFGDYGPGRFAWILKDVVALKEPIPVKGALGLWAIPPEAEAVIMKQIRKETDTCPTGNAPPPP